MKVNIKATLRIYIVLGVCWSSWWLIRWGDNYDGILQHEIIINALIPLPLYFAVRWILKAFKQ